MCCSFLTFILMPCMCVLLSGTTYARLFFFFFFNCFCKRQEGEISIWTRDFFFFFFLASKSDSHKMKPNNSSSIIWKGQVTWMQGQYLSILVDLSTQHLGMWDRVFTTSLLLLWNERCLSWRERKIQGSLKAQKKKANGWGHNVR